MLLPRTLFDSLLASFMQNGRTKFIQDLFPSEVLQAQYDAATDPMQKSFIGLMLCYAGGDPIDMRAIQKTFSVQLTPLKKYINKVIRFP